MSVNGLVAVAIAFTLAGTIARACKPTGATGTQETSVIPNNKEASRRLGVALAA